MSTSQETEVSQLLFLRLKENRWSKSLEKSLRETPPGGVLLAEPLPRSINDTHEFITKVRRACTGPIFTAIRQDGGECDPLSRFLPALPSPRAVALKGSDAVGRMAGLIGEALRLLGINADFAPALDLASDSIGAKSGSRLLGSDPDLVAACGESFISGLALHKILACGKHFPGAASAPAERAGDLPVSAKPMAALWREDLLPYRRLLPKVPMVLISSAAYKAYDFDIPRPASLSPLVVEGLLRTKLAYRGLALAYDLESESVHGALGFGGAAVQAVVAGCDMIVVDQGRPFEAARQALQRGLECGNLSGARVKEAVGRIRAAVRRLPPSPRKLTARRIQNLQKRFELFCRNEEIGDA